MRAIIWAQIYVQNALLCDSPSSLPRLIVVRLLGEVIRDIMCGVPQLVVRYYPVCITLVLHVHNKDHSCYV
mgnify:CR=1 FL=1